MASVHQDVPSFCWLGRQAYEATYERLRRRAWELAEAAAAEVIWACEHDPVYTTGRRGVIKLRRDRLEAPIVHTDRGGEITYHGPGQLMLYPVVHLRRRKIAARAYVALLEQSCIELLADLGIAAGRRCGWPGVWIGDAKIAAIGLRISRGVAYHGMALNVAVAPGWFDAINACGTGRANINLSDCLHELPALPELAAYWAGCCLALLDRPV